MAKKLKKTSSIIKKPVAKKERVDPRVEKVYEETVTFTCPVRGLVKQKVKIKRYKPLSEIGEKHIVQADELIDKIENEDDGLSIYKEGEPDEGHM
jgi:hypothetical protein